MEPRIRHSEIGQTHADCAGATPRETGTPATVTMATVTVTMATLSDHAIIYYSVSNHRTVILAIPPVI